MLFVSIVIIALLLLCAFSKIKHTLIFFGACVIFMVMGQLTLQDVASGFSNPALITVVLMLLISDALKRLGIINFLFNSALEKIKHIRSLIAGTAVSVGLLSAIFNNIPLVSVSIPAFKRWSKLHAIHPGKLLLPLSYISILGGAMTLIGTSTNLVADALVRDLGLGSLQFFDFAAVGSIMFVFGTVYLIVFAPKILNYNTPLQNQTSKTFVLEFSIEAGSVLVNKSVENAKLRALPGVFLAEIIRDQQHLSAVSPKEILQPNDKLLFVGDVDGFLELKAIAGLSLPKKLDLNKEENDISELVISTNSKLDGVLVKESDFRSRYGGAIVAIHRNGEKLSGRIGDIKLLAGDVLLVLSGSDFVNRIKNNPAFILASNNKNHFGQLSKAGNFGLLGLLIAAVILPLVLNFQLQYSLLIYLFFLLTVFRKDIGDLRSSIDYDLILLMVFGLAIGKAIAHSIADNPELFQLNGIEHYTSGPIFIALLFLGCNFLSSIISGKAVLSIVLPFLAGLHLTHNLENIHSLIMVITFASAVSFVSPFGYQTNLMVYGIGQYKFKDYIKLGLPLTIAYALTCALYYG